MMIYVNPGAIRLCYTGFIAASCLSAAVTERQRVALPLVCWSLPMSSSPMKTYRVYCFDGVHKALTSDLIEAATDEQAITMAEQAGYGSRCEIWEGRRLVAELGERKSA